MTKQPIRICLRMDATVMAATIRQIFSAPGKQEFVETVEEADAVIFDLFRLVSDDFDSSKPYLQITGLNGQPHRQAAQQNVTTVHGAVDLLQSLIKFLRDNFNPEQP